MEKEVQRQEHKWRTLQLSLFSCKPTCRWPRQDWVLHPLPLLTGKARAAYVAMDPDDALNYDDVKQAILDKFEINNEMYRQRFRLYSAQEDETPRELQICDQIVLEQFLKLLSSETRTWVKQNNPTSSKQAAEMAEAFMAARRSLYQPRRWRNYSNSPTGKSGDGLSSGLTNSNSSSYGPQVNLGTDTSKHQGVVNRYKGKSVIVCHACGQPGHKKVDCPVQKVSNTRLCYVPRPFLEFSEVELNRDTVIEVKIGNKFFKALVDSGSSQTLVRTECLSELDISRQGKLRVCCIHGDEREYPKTDLVIEIDNQAYNLTFGIVEQAPYPVILGRDVPVLVDLLQTDRELAEARVVTRAQAKHDETCKQSLKDLPFEVHPKVKKSRRDRRQRKVEGTKVIEELPKPCTDEIEHIPHDIVQLQRQDKTLKSLFEKAENVTSSLGLQKDHFVIKDNRLYVQGAEGERLVVPEPIRLKVLQLGHSVPWAGHLGQLKMLARIASRFYWPRLYMDVMDFCRSCPECQLVSPAKKGDRAPLVSLPI
uniref:Gypsy retrotransposon integrase-like protein 1 n=1 Tax=Sinocyclocheilus anshuiensis TaxID=1608454 RepID=A0A671RWP3_9TELE